MKADLQDITIPLHIILGFIVPLPLRRVRRIPGRRGRGTPRSRRSGRLKRSAGVRPIISAQETVAQYKPLNSHSTSSTAPSAPQRTHSSSPNATISRDVYFSNAAKTSHGCQNPLPPSRIPPSDIFCAPSAADAPSNRRDRDRSGVRSTFRAVVFRGRERKMTAGGNRDRLRRQGRN
jgi:hypothetical protein